MKSEKISVFGASGFIGSNFVQKFKDECIVVPREERIPPTDNVLYFISTTHNYHIHDDMHKDVRTNLSVLLEVLENCKERDVTFNFISSWFVYGDTNLPAREDSICNPAGFYSITKRCAEQLIVSFCKTFDKSYRILRLSNVYGSSDPGAGKKKNALQFLIENMKDDLDVDLYHGGEFIRDYLHVNDVCDAIKLVMNESSANDVINVGSGTPYRFIDLINLARKILNSGSKINKINPPEFHKIVQVKDMFLDVEKLKALGFQPKVSIDEGIKELCQI